MFRQGSSLYFEKSGLIIDIQKDILGEGGFSTVYKASNRKNSSQFAVKKVLIQNEELNRSVLTEIRSLNQFRHANIVKMVDSVEGRDDTNKRVVYILFPLVKRGTLRDVLNLRLKGDPDRASLVLETVINDFKAICSAFNYMHTFSPVKYIHQDIKPEVSSRR